MFESMFKDQILHLSMEQMLTNAFWSEIQRRYAENHRHYHNLLHLEDITAELFIIKHEINDWSTLVFSIAYHDIIYEPAMGNNEERSAELAQHRLIRLNLPGSQIEKCKLQILATKDHRRSAETDTNYFIDADISILGKEPQQYQKYATSVRQEYGMYSDAAYHAGRQKVLEKFLQRQSIYHTKHFQTKYEAMARRNLMQELKMPAT